MNESQYFEALGRKQAALDNLQHEYANLLDLVRRLKAGSPKLDYVEVDGDSWRIVRHSQVDPGP